MRILKLSLMIVFCGMIQIPENAQTEKKYLSLWVAIVVTVWRDLFFLNNFLFSCAAADITQ